MQTLNGKAKRNDAASFAWDVGGVSRHAIGQYSFAVDGGAAAAHTIFTVTGDVALQIFGLCKTSLTSGGAATCELGIAGSTASLIAQTGFDAIDQYETWQDATPEANPGAITSLPTFVIANGANVIMTIATAALTAGVIDFHAYWVPLSTNGNVVAA